MPGDSNGPLNAGGKWSAVVIASRETPELLFRTINAIWTATQIPPILDIVVNGNADLGRCIQAAIRLQPIPAQQTVRVWSIPTGDKANALNQYIHRIWIEEGVVHFIDGYARVRPDAFAILNRELASDNHALAAAATPCCGRSAKVLRLQMETQGGLHGNLFTLKENTIRRLKAMAFRLPLGIYRTDSTIGAVLAFNMDPARNKWDVRGYIRVSTQASWETDERTWWRIGELKAQAKRKMRQAQGLLENAAVKTHLAEQRKLPADMPSTARDLVTDWIAAHPEQARRLFRSNPLTRIALGNLEKDHRDWSDENIAPQLLLETMSVAGVPN
jgi:hypothetical protein